MAAEGKDNLREASAAEANQVPFNVSRFIANPPAAGQYVKTSTGPDIEIGTEPIKRTPVDGSSKWLRSLSPFVVRLEPPLIYGADPSILDRNRKVRKPGIFDAAYTSGGRNGFVSSRQALAKSELVSGDFSWPQPGEFTAKSGGGFRYVSKGRTDSRDRKGDSWEGQLGQVSLAGIDKARNIALQIKNLMSTPPLVMLINPQSLSVNHTRIHQFQERTRFGYVYQAWGEDQPKLSMSFRCGAFISSSRGVQSASKRDSAAWQNIQALFHFYKNNGYIHDTIDKSNAHHVVGAISLHYDRWTYYGHFQSFSWSFEETNTQGGVTINIDFVASSILDHSPPVVADGSVGSLYPAKSPNRQTNDPKLVSNRYRPPQEGEVQFVVGRQGGTWDFPIQVGGRATGGRVSSPDPDVSPQVRVAATGRGGTISLPVSDGGFRRGA